MARAYAVNASGGSTQGRRVYAVNASGGSTQAKKGYAVNSSGGTTLIYQNDETIINNLSLETAVSVSAGEKKEVYSSEYSASGFSTMKLTGTVSRTVTSGEGSGYYGCTSRGYLQGWNGSSWANIATLSYTDFNTSATSTINQTINISGYTKFRVYLSNQCSTQTLHVQGKTGISGFTAIAYA